MGKGDRRTRRGKIYAGSFGKLRPKDPSSGKKTAAAGAAGKSASKPAGRSTARRTKA